MDDEPGWYTTANIVIDLALIAVGVAAVALIPIIIKQIIGS